MRMHEETVPEQAPATHSVLTSSAPPDGGATQDIPGQSDPAAQARVTPKELTDAVARIEARRDDGRRLREATIPIGEALQQLGLDATPEEVLAEVQAVRVRQQQRPARRRTLAVLVAACTGALGLASMLGAVALHGVAHPPAYAISPVIAVETGGVPASSSVTPESSPPATPTVFGPSLQVRDGSGRLVLLSEVKDGQTVRTFLSNDGASLLDYVPFSRSNQVSWGLVKYNNRVYLRAYTVPLSPGLLRARGTTLSSEPYDESVVPITLPLDALRVVSGSRTEAQVAHSSQGLEFEGDTPTPEIFQTDGVVADGHVSEKW